MSLAQTSKAMHQRMAPFMYQTLKIFKQLYGLVDHVRPRESEKYQKTFFQEDGSREMLSILSIVKDLRILPQPWRFLLTDHPTAMGNQHTYVLLRNLSSIAVHIFRRLSPGKLGHFAYVF